MRQAVIDARGNVVNVIEAEAGFVIDGHTLIETAQAGPGWRYENGAFVAPPEPDPEPPTADDVHREEQRRLMLVVGASTPDDLRRKLDRATRESVKMIDKGKGEWTPQEQARAARLRQLSDAVDAIEDAADALSANPPADYTDDTHWPRR